MGRRIKNITRTNPKPQAFGELGNVGEALFQGLGQQYMVDRVKFGQRVGAPVDPIVLADMAETASIAMIASILPVPDRASIKDIIDAGMSVDHLPVVNSDHRIQEALIAHA